MTVPPSGKPVSQLDSEWREWADQQPCRTSCVFCGWEVAGTAEECRAAASAHRQVEHPHIRPRRRRTGSIGRWRNTQDDYRAEGLARAAEVARMVNRDVA